jgi:plant G-box-binding factor
MAMAGGEQTESKPEAKDGSGGKVAPLKRSKGSRGSLQLLKVGADGGAGKQQRNGVSHNSNGVSHSSNGEENETGSDGSTEGSRDENEQNMLPKRRFIELMAMEGGGAGAAAGGGGYMAPPGGVIPGTPSSAGAGGQAGGSLDMSLDYWSAGSVPAAAKPAKQQLSGSPTTNGPPTELWLHDERELKRQRRKQSNRESARRSRLRKQAECEELETRVDTLTVENVTLRAELTRVTEECKRLQGENGSLMQQLRTSPASDAIPATQSAAATKEIHATDKEMIDAAANMGNGNVLSKADKASGEKFLYLFLSPSAVIIWRHGTKL